MSAPVPPRPRPPAARLFAVAALLAALTAAAFWGVTASGWAPDDSGYYLWNRDLDRGLTADGVRWALTATVQANWHPLTWLSLMVDRRLFGTSPAGPHLVNLLLHAGSAVLLFVVLARMTGALWRSALAAALFAIHPLRVESVAWVSERKDVLAGLFWMLTLLAYLSHARRPGASRLAAVAAVFAVGLAAKPMLVTLPFALLLLDAWPLGRLRRGRIARTAAEKVPLLALAAAASTATYLAQRAGGAVRTLEEFPLPVRAANAVLSWAAYLRQTLWPGPLAIVYPYPGQALFREAAVALAVLAAVTAVALLAARRRPALPVGWLWYAGTLVPVIGLVQVGGQPLADRYTYLPLIGIFLALAFAGPVPARRRVRAAAAVAALVALALLAGLTRRQTAFWKDELTLYRHAAAAVPGNAEAHSHVGFLLSWQGGDPEEALRHFREALRIAPESVETRINLGVALARWGRPAEAAQVLREAVGLAPASARVRVNLARALEQGGRPEEAARQYAEALRLEPGRAEAAAGLARLRPRPAP